MAIAGKKCTRGLSPCALDSSRRTVAATAVDEVFLIGKVGAGGGEDAASQQACLLL